MSSSSRSGRLDGRVALVTGGGRGIGRAIGRALAADGASVCLVARSEPELRAAAEEIGASYVAVSLATEDGCVQTIEETRRRLGPIAILVNNAGMGSYEERPIWDQATTTWRDTMAVNLDAPFLLTRLAVADMIEAGWGRIVMISSTAGEVGAPAMSAYCASKHGLIGLMRSVAADTIPHGVTCNAVLPGWVRTTMADADADAEGRALGKTAEEVWEERAASYAAKRVLEPSEIAGVVRFLASDDASGVNGEAITVALGSLW
jgi:NAD(P)-dependent dehydrogenase (short-subunit alcohol dehydrogenase family)